MNPIVSIVIPVYNSSKYLTACLDSILAQTYALLDIVCVNDGSTDDSEKILKEYEKKDSRIRVVNNDSKEKGAAFARNIGLKNAIGDYIQFLDSDDFFDEDMIEQLVKKAVENDADLVICKGKFFDDEKQIITGNMPHPDLQYAPDKEWFCWTECEEYICEISENYSWNKLYKKELIIENNLYFTPQQIGEDQYISMIAPVVARRISVIDKPFISYRIGTGNSLCDGKHNIPQGCYEGVFEIVKRFKELSVWNKVKQSYLNVSIRLMREYFDQMKSYDSLKFLYEKFRNVIFPFLELNDVTEGTFHDKRVWEWYNMVTTHKLGEILFLANKAHGATMTTASLRFQVPYSDIKKNSRIALVGKGLAGRYWFSQLLLSKYCEVVYWVEDVNDIPERESIDSVVISK